ncbi:low-specificity L-threonine aldolase [Hazenella coriacea]|uniref:L-threonine aldolase n=1 Tax=Hazenella coriacea TaxID=1179467 RepID=A0A4R3L2I1_9BACL|nr:low-specificity L-threonine aldolase [Hazenella coriacea]TCS92400.1 L-threonine aldolase [Hazenella coriacea]
MIELRSDTFTLPTEEMIRAMSQAKLGDDVYKEDPTVNRLEELSAEMLGKEDACFLPSGTMANLTSLLTHCPRGTKVLVGNETDIYIYEAGGASVCGGVIYEPIATQPDGKLLLEDLEAAFPVDPEDPQFSLPSLICLENTHNRCGGRVLPLDYLREVQQFAYQKSLPVHMDGARVFHAAVALQRPVSEITAYADSIQFCLSKGLSSPVGSMVAGTKSFIEGVRRWRKLLGGGMRQAGVIAAAGIVSLTHMVDRLAEDHHHAQQFAIGLKDISGIAVDLNQVETNIVFFKITDERFTWESFIEAMRAENVLLAELGHGRIRAVFHRGVSSSDVDQALAKIDKVMKQGPL